MNPQIWGQDMWRSIHRIAATYTSGNKEAFILFIYSLTDLLPCKICREHLKINMENHPLTDEYLQNNKTAFLWTYILHEIVNKQLKKPSYPYSKAYYDYFGVYPNNHYTQSLNMYSY